MIVVDSPTLRTSVTLSILAGAAFFLYIYHVRTRRFDPSQRPRVMSWPGYALVDLYLKVSTLAITLAAIQLDDRLLLKVHEFVPLRLFGLALSGLALLLFSTAMWTLDAHYTPAHQSHVPTAIVQTGPYRYIRHPVYTSNLILLVGMFLVSGSLWIVVNLVILIAYYLPTIMIEEAAIKRHLPAYHGYALRTGMLFPRLRARGDQRDEKESQ